MKRYILFFALILLVVPAQAQRQHNHFKRVKITPQETPTSESDETRIKQNEVISTEKNELTIVPVQSTLKPDNSGYTRIISRKKVRTIPTADMDQMSQATFIKKVLETHDQLKSINDIQKPLLRTWKWLLIVCAIFVALAIVFIIVGYIKTKYFGLTTAGYVIGPLFLLAGIIVTILGISGRI